MTMWLMIMYVTLILTGSCLIYLCNRVSRFSFMSGRFLQNAKLKFSLSAVLVFAVFFVVGLVLNFINAIVCAIYFALCWLTVDFLFWVFDRFKILNFEKTNNLSGMVAIGLSLAVLCAGWYADHHVWKTEYTFYSDKLSRDMKIVGFADSHIGTTFNAEGFAKHLAKIQEQKPDVLIVAGDFVDDDTTKEDMIAACKSLGTVKTTYGVYLVFGNHDKGYYGAAHRGFSGMELVDELEKNGVKVLFDETMLLADDLYLIGRRDYSVKKEQRGKRASMEELTANAEKSKFIFVADHQPADYENQAKAEVDLVFSGHTHGGQLFPFNQIGKWIGANNLVYGHEKRNKTDFIVTSGISDWAIKFKTGTKSEYVVINLLSRQNVSDR